MDKFFFTIFVIAYDICRWADIFLVNVLLKLFRTQNLAILNQQGGITISSTVDVYQIHCVFGAVCVGLSSGVGCLLLILVDGSQDLECRIGVQLPALFYGLIWE